MASEERDQLLANLRRLQLRHAANRIDDLLRDAARVNSAIWESIESSIAKCWSGPRPPPIVAFRKPFPRDLAD